MKAIFFSFLNHVICLLAIDLSSLYILDIKPLSHVWFANLFSYYVGYPFTLLIISFTVQKLSGLMLSYLSNFALAVCTFGVRCLKSLPASVKKHFL